MNVKEKMQADVLTALKAGDTLTTRTLRTVLGNIQTQEKAGKTSADFTNDQVIDAVRREMKRRQETAKEFAELGRTDRADEETAEAKVLEAYLPTQLSEADVEAVVVEVLAGFDAPTKADFGSIMKQVLARVGKASDGKTVSTILNRLMS